MATDNREDTFNESRKQSSGELKIIIPQRNTEESFEVLPEWGFESSYLDLKRLENPRGHLGFTRETQPSNCLFFFFLTKNNVMFARTRKQTMT